MSQRTGEITIDELSAELQTLVKSGGAEVSWEDIKDKPEALPADGGNADTVGGVSIDSIFHEGNMPNIEDLGAVKVYKSLQEISADFTNTTPIGNVIKAMDNNSMAMFEVLADNGKYPVPYCIVTMYKVNDTRNKVEALSVNDGKMFVTNYHHVHNPNCEWKDVPTQTIIPITNDMMRNGWIVDTNIGNNFLQIEGNIVTIEATVSATNGILKDSTIIMQLPEHLIPISNPYIRLHARYLNKLFSLRVTKDGTILIANFGGSPTAKDMAGYYMTGRWGI